MVTDVFHQYLKILSLRFSNTISPSFRYFLLELSTYMLGLSIYLTSLLTIYPCVCAIFWVTYSLYSITPSLELLLTFYFHYLVSLSPKQIKQGVSFFALFLESVLSLSFQAFSNNKQVSLSDSLVFSFALWRMFLLKSLLSEM